MPLFARLRQAAAQERAVPLELWALVFGFVLVAWGMAEAVSREKKAGGGGGRASWMRPLRPALLLRHLMRGIFIVARLEACSVAETTPMLPQMVSAGSGPGPAASPQ